MTNAGNDNTIREMYWDEDSRLRVLSDNGKSYNFAKIQRINRNFLLKSPNDGFGLQEFYLEVSRLF